MFQAITDEGDARRAAIRQLGVLERIADPALQGLARLAAHASGSSCAAIHIIGEDSQHRIAAHAAPLGEHPAADSMCRLVVERDEPIVTADAAADGRFAYSSLVAGEEPVRFYASYPLRIGAGETIGTVCAWDTERFQLPEGSTRLLEDISVQASTHMELMRMVGDLGTAATRDELTGAANRLILGDRLAHHLSRLSRHDTEVTVAVVDLDGFTAINDSLGHAAGDRVLQEVVRRLIESVREEDLVARIGVDKFAVVAEFESGGLDPEVFRRRLTDALAKPITARGRLAEIGASVGVVLARAGESATDVLARADAEMYQRKGS